MFYILGYISASFLFVVGLCTVLGSLYKSSHLQPKLRVNKTPPSLSSRVIISFSIILPFAVLSFVFLNFAAMKMAQNLAHDGHTRFVVSSLSVPTLCFLLGYLYFKRVVSP